MLTAVIIIFVLLLILAAFSGMLQFFAELEEYNRRSQDYTDMMHEADELSNKEDEQ